MPFIHCNIHSKLCSVQEQFAIKHCQFIEEEACTNKISYHLHTYEIRFKYCLCVMQISWPTLSVMQTRVFVTPKYTKYKYNVYKFLLIVLCDILPNITKLLMDLFSIFPSYTVIDNFHKASVQVPVCYNILIKGLEI
jgi:hypothetical protein